MINIKCAAIDIGTNSVLLTIAENTPPNSFMTCYEEALVTRLGANIDKTGSLEPLAIKRTLDALRHYAQIIENHQPLTLAVAATSATRDASNSTAFIKPAEDILNCTIEIVSGKREAELCLGGVKSISPNLSSNSLIFDIGGGSTEFIRTQNDTVQCISLQLGTVRFRERYTRTDILTDDDYKTLCAAIDSQLAPVLPWIAECSELIGVAGTVTSLAALDGGVYPYDPARINGYTLSAQAIEKLQATVFKLSLPERMVQTNLEEHRADILPTGAVIVERILNASSLQAITVCDRGVRWGLLYELFNENE